ncbi:MAG: OmpA family protein [Acidobacteria bacterium]|nr:OmpA family protein [Acidobacteriota bacterium]
MMAGPAPELDVLIVPSLILEGESAMLSWEARNSDRVIINNNIGLVELSGRIKLFPDETTSYDVIAEGLGGRVTKTIIVEVFKDDTRRLSEDDLSDRPLEEQFEYFVEPVFFPYDSAVLSQEASLTLDGNADWLTRPENLGIRFLIEGHCDQRGTEEYNLALGDTRAQAVLAYLARQGIDLSRVKALALGEERPFDLRQTEEGWRLNRRAHFVLTQ